MSMPTVRCSFVHAHRALLFFDPLRLVTRCIESALQAGLSRLAVADEHQPQLVHGDFRAGAHKLQNCRPSLGHNFAGRNRQPFALPSVIADAGGGLGVMEIECQLDVVQDAGDDAAHGSDADSVVALQNSCWPSRTAIEKQTRIQNKKTSTKIILQGSESASCCSVAERQQSPSLPRRRLGCRPAKLMLALTHGDQNYQSHKDQFLQSANFARCHALSKLNAIIL
jgi:hypothetical protein